MVWVCIWLDESGIPRRSDPDAPHGGYSAQSYIEMLRKGLLPHYHGRQLSMHENTSIHTARVVEKFLIKHNFKVIDWPAYSPDLNPIEYILWVLKNLMYKNFPQYNNYSLAKEEWDDFCKALKRCWRSIPGRLIKSLILSMPRRLATCRKANTWHTKY
jgi:transposase